VLAGALPSMASISSKLAASVAALPESVLSSGLSSV
jgi:hypothetical protein